MVRDCLTCLMLAHPPAVLWTDDDNRELIKSRYPELLATYDGLPLAITRADFMRNFYMHAFGGIYADLDSEPIARLHEIEARQVPTAYLGAMNTVTEFALNHSIPNAWMASAPGHPFWLWPVTEAQRVMSMENLPAEMNSASNLNTSLEILTESL